MARQHQKALPFAVSDFERPAVQDEGPADQSSTSGTPSPSVYELIWHASDSSVKPIVANRRIERLPEPKWDAQALPFKPLVGPCQLVHTGCSCPLGIAANGRANSFPDALLFTFHWSCITILLGRNIVSTIGGRRHAELHLRICLHIRIFTYLYIYIYIYLHIYIFTYTFTYTYVHTYIYIYLVSTTTATTPVVVPKLIVRFPGHDELGTCSTSLVSSLFLLLYPG